MDPRYEEPTELRPLEPAIRTVWRIKSALFWTLLFLGVAAYEVITFLGGGGVLPFGIIMGVVYRLDLRRTAALTAGSGDSTSDPTSFFWSGEF